MNTLFKPTSYKKGAALAVGATFVWKAISFANALLLALYFGADRQTDVYFYLIMLLGFGVAFLQRLNQNVLIPEAMFLAQEDKTKANRFVNMWLSVYAGIGLLSGIVGLLGAETLWRVFSRFSSPVLAQDQRLLTCGFILFGLQIITYYLTAIAEMYKFFKTAWLGVLNAVCPLFCLLILGNKLGIISMVYGFLVANVIQIVLLLCLLKTQLAWQFEPAWVSLRTQTRQNMVAGQTLAVVEMINSWLPVYLITGMGAGLISALNYCRQLTDSPTEIITARTANVAKIEMTALAAKRRQTAFNEVLLRLNHLLLVILLPLAVFSCYFAPQIVELFFKRGHFNSQAAQNTVLFLRPMLFTVVLLVPAYVFSNATAAWRKIKESFPYALCMAVAFTIAVAVLLPRYGAFSFPYISLGGLIVGFMVNYFFFQQHLPFVSYVDVFKDMGRLAVLNGIALFPAVLMSELVFWWPSFWVLFVSGCVFMGCYLCLLAHTQDGPRFMREIKQADKTTF